MSLNQKLQLFLAGIVAINVGIATFFYADGSYALASFNFAAAVFCYVANFCEVKRREAIAVAMPSRFLRIWLISR